MVTIKRDTPTISEILLYTKAIRENRFDYMERDVLKKVVITHKHTYKKESLKKSKSAMPDEKLEITTYSYPQYSPYSKLGSDRKQRKVKHSYDITFVFQKNPASEQFDMGSKVIWRVGSFKKWKTPNQKYVKTIYKETSTKLKKRYSDQPEKYYKMIKQMKKSGKYLDIGDYNSQENGINGDFYFRSMPLCYAFNCLYGPVTQAEFSDRDKDIQFPFFGKHELRVILFLISRGYIKK